VTAVAKPPFRDYEIHIVALAIVANNCHLYVADETLLLFCHIGVKCTKHQVSVLNPKRHVTCALDLVEIELQNQTVGAAWNLERLRDLRLLSRASATAEVITKFVGGQRCTIYPRITLTSLIVLVNKVGVCFIATRQLWLLTLSRLNLTRNAELVHDRVGTRSRYSAASRNTINCRVAIKDVVLRVDVHRGKAIDTDCCVVTKWTRRDTIVLFANLANISRSVVSCDLTNFAV
jgi:hypothetical protein